MLAAGCGEGLQVSAVPVDGQGTPRPAEQESASLWEAGENLDLDYRPAGTEPEEGRILLEGLRLSYLGQPAAAEELFGELCRESAATEIGKVELVETHAVELPTESAFELGKLGAVRAGTGKRSKFLELFGGVRDIALIKADVVFQ